MAGLAVDGLISGLNTSEIIQALLFNHRAPALRLATRRDSITEKLSAIQGLNATVLGIRVASESLGSIANFRGRSASSTNESIVTATATSEAEAGSFAVTVQQLAQNQQISSDPNNVFTDPDAALGVEGDIQVNGTLVSVRSTDTLRDVASRISNAGAGVSANVIEVDTDQFRFSVRSLSTGADGFSLTNRGSVDVIEALRIVDGGAPDVIANPITDGGASQEFNVRSLPVAGLLNLDSNIPSGTVTIGNGSGSINVAVDLNTDSLDDIALAINNAASGAGSSISASINEVETGVFQLEIVSGDATTPTFTDSNNVLETIGVLEPTFLQVDQQGLDAQFEINGISVVRSGNAISDVIDGVTFTLIDDEDPAAVSTITVQTSYDGAADAVQALVNAINNTQGYTDAVASFNADTKSGGILLGDTAVRSVEGTLSNLLVRSVSTLRGQRLDTLNSGGGVATGSIQITDRSGATATIDLTNVDTVEEVLDAINLNQDVSVEITTSSDGTGFDIKDTSVGTGSLTIAEVSGGTTAADLGLLGSSAFGRIEGAAVAQAEFLSLTELGISTNVDGSISFDSSVLEGFLETNPTQVEAFFTQEEEGFAAIAQDAIDLLTDSTKGSLTVRADSLESSIESYNESIGDIEERLVLVEERLRRQFSQLEQSLAQIQNQGDFLLSQLSQLSNFNTGKKK